LTAFYRAPPMNNKVAVGKVGGPTAVISRVRRHS
jgi:hypothetical protein